VLGLRQDPAVGSSCPVSALSEISTPHVPLPDARDVTEGPAPAATLDAWSPRDMPQARRPTPTTLVVVASCAGVGALVLGVLAGASTLSGSKKAAEPPAVVKSAAPPAELQALALLAKPSTERVVFRGSGGRLLLAVGSGGRAAILIRGLERAAPDRPYGAWIVGRGRPFRAARFDGTERAVFLSVPLGRHESVVVARSRSTSLGSASQLVAPRS
jgi:hypothetical protein